MLDKDENGRIKLNWAQAIQAVVLLVSLASGWATLHSTQNEIIRRLAALELVAQDKIYSRTEIDLMRSIAQQERTDLRERVSKLERGGRHRRED